MEENQFAGAREQYAKKKILIFLRSFRALGVRALYPLLCLGGEYKLAGARGRK